MVRPFLTVVCSSAHSSDHDGFACQDFAIVKVHEDLIFLSRSCDDYSFGQDSTLKFRMSRVHSSRFLVRSFLDCERRFDYYARGPLSMPVCDSMPKGDILGP